MWLKKKRVYLDAVSGVPVSSCVSRAYQTALQTYGNPSSPHQEGRDAATLLATARKTIARVCEAKPDDVVCVASATEANNIAICGVVRAAQQRLQRTDVHVLYMPSAHASIVEPMQQLKRQGVQVEALQVTEGAVDIVALAKQLRPETVLVSMDRVCGETGVIWDTRAVRHLLDEARPVGSDRIMLHVDALHAPRIESIERTRIAGDLITLDAQKVGGVRGAAVLIVSRTVLLEPLFFGGTQERGLAPGTENVAALVAFAEALTQAHTEREAFSVHTQLLRTAILDGVSHIANVYENTGKEQAPHILNLSFIGRDTDYLVALLDAAGFAVSTKSACETDSEEGSRAVQVITGDHARASATLRISFTKESTMRDVRRFVRALVAAVAFLDSHTL